MKMKSASASKKSKGKLKKILAKDDVEKFVQCKTEGCENHAMPGRERCIECIEKAKAKVVYAQAIAQTLEEREKKQNERKEGFWKRKFRKQA